MTQEHASINGALLRLRREARGWLQSDVATRACMSIKQIRQLEEGGLSAFYSEAVKVTAARKVGNLMGLTEDEVFSHGQPEVASTASSISPEADLAALLASTHDADHDAHSPHTEHTEPGHDDHAHHAQETEHVQDEVTAPSHEEVFAQSAYKTPSASVNEAQPEVVTPVTEEASSAAKSKTSLIGIAVLFVGAIVLAAIFRPDQEVPPTEPPPPLQPALQVEGGPESGKDGVAPTDGVATPALPAASSTPATNTPATPAPVTPTPTTGSGTSSVATPAPVTAPTATPSAVPAATPKTN